MSGHLVASGRVPEPKQTIFAQRGNFFVIDGRPPRGDDGRPGRIGNRKLLSCIQVVNPDPSVRCGCEQPIPVSGPCHGGHADAQAAREWELPLCLRHCEEDCLSQRVACGENVPARVPDELADFDLGDGSDGLIWHRCVERPTAFLAELVFGCLRSAMWARDHRFLGRWNGLLWRLRCLAPSCFGLRFRQHLAAKRALGGRGGDALLAECAGLARGLSDCTRSDAGQNGRSPRGKQCNGTRHDRQEQSVPHPTILS